MRLLRLMGLGLLAAFVLATAAASGASASEPALWQCGAAVKNATTKKYEGKYEKGCKTLNAKGEGKYEFEEWRLGSKTTGGKKGKAKKFKSKGSPPGTLEVPHVSTVECAHTYDEGEFTGPKTAGNIKARFTGCKASSEACQSGSTTGEIITNVLKGEIGYIKGDKATHKVGVDIKAQSGEVLAELTCGLPPAPILRLRVTGSLIGEVAPVNAWSKEATINFEQVGGKQKIQELEGMTEPDVLLTAYCKAKEPCTPVEPTESGESVKGVGKGEELYLKA
jgi:hypothetical protein